MPFFCLLADPGIPGGGTLKRDFPIFPINICCLRLACRRFAIENKMHAIYLTLELLVIYKVNCFSVIHLYPRLLKPGSGKRNTLNYFFGCCTADWQPIISQNQLYNSIKFVQGVPFFIAWLQRVVTRAFKLLRSSAEFHHWCWQTENRVNRANDFFIPISCSLAQESYTLPYYNVLSTLLRFYMYSKSWPLQFLMLYLCSRDIVTY